jgi:NTE family protein
LRGALQAFGVLNYTFAFNPLTFADGLLGRRNYLFDNRSLARFLGHVLPVENLQDTALPLSVLTTDVRSGQAVILSRGPALPTLLASTAIPAIYPNVKIDDHVLMDGGIADHTTLDCAVDNGADEVYLLAPGFSCYLPALPSTAIAMALHGYNLLNEQRMNASIAHNLHHARLHVLPALCPVEVLPIDFAQTAALIERATESTLHWLDRREPKPGIARALGDHHPADHRSHQA